MNNLDLKLSEAALEAVKSLENSKLDQKTQRKIIQEVVKHLVKVQLLIDLHAPLNNTDSTH